MSLLIKSLKVTNFGGINGTIDLDLSAPLTVIYAPNGTGKTSFVESLYWTFHSSSDDEIREARCREAPAGESTTISMDVEVSGQSLSVVRTVSPNGMEERFINGEGGFGVTTFLSALAPDCKVSELAAVSQKVRLVNYLCSNRLLTTKTLSRLIDLSDAEGRSDAMADLLGTRALKNSAKQIRLYRTKLADEFSSLNREIEGRGATVASLRTRLQSVSGELEAINQDLKGTIGSDFIPPGIDGQTKLETLVESELLRQADVDSALTALRTFPNLPTKDQIAEKERQLTELGQRKAILDKRQADLRGSISTNTEEQNKLKAALSNLRQLHSNVVALSNAIQPNDGQINCSRLRETLDFFMSQFGSLRKARERFSDIREMTLSLSQAKARIQQAESRISTLKEEASRLPKHDELENGLRTISIHIGEEQTRASSLKTSSNSLSILSKQIHGATPNSTKCPTCGHDWESHDRLGNAIEQGLSALSPAILASEALIQTLIGQLQELRKLGAQAESLERQIQDGERSLKRDRDAIASAAELAKKFGLSDESAINEEAITALNHRIELADAFSSAISMDLVTDFGGLWYSDSETPSTWQSRIQAAGLNERKKSDDLEVTRVEDLKSLSDTQKLLEDIQGMESNLRREITNGRTSAGVMERMMKIARISALSETTLESAASESSARRFLFLQAQAKLAVRRRILENASVQNELEAVETELKPLTNCAARLIKEVDTCDAILRKIDSAAQAQGDSVFSNLAPTVSELFQRMQVNRVFDSVSIDSNFQLRAQIGDDEFAPDLFSDGQRQDLALSFFLARAYSMSGTFVLDEPLAHLDDVNKVALFDTLRALVLSNMHNDRKTGIVLTTASWQTARHIIEKFLNSSHDSSPLVSVYQLGGNVRSGVTATKVFPQPSVQVKSAAH